MLGAMTDHPNVNNLKRFTICKLAGHNWVKVPHPSSADEEGAGTFLRCQRCDRENHDAGTVPRGAGGRPSTSAFQ
jgi:hypothetical protein